MVVTTINKKQLNQKPELVIIYDYDIVIIDDILQKISKNDEEENVMDGEKKIQKVSSNENEAWLKGGRNKRSQKY